MLEALEARLPPTAHLTLPTSGIVTDAEGGTASFPIGINQLEDNANPINHVGHVGLASFTLAVTYPTGVFVTPTNVVLGSVPMSAPTFWTTSLFSPADGQLDITVKYVNSPITSDNPPTGGSLVIIDFTVEGYYNPARPTAESIEVVPANGTFQTAINGANGTYVLNPAPPYSGTLLVNPALTVVSQDLANWTANTAGYNQQFLASGGTGGKTWTLSSGSLPPGLTLSNTGALTGTPTTAGTYTFLVTANDSLGEGPYQSSDVLTQVPEVSPHEFPTGISGTNIVGYFDDSAGTHGFLTNTSQSNFSVFDDPAGVYGTTIASGISGSLIVGSYADAAGTRHGFVYDGSTFKPLDFPGSTFTVATGIAGNTIVGYFEFEGNVYSFEYNGTWNSLINLDSGYLADAISGNSIVGQYSYQVGGQTDSNVFLYDLPTHSSSIPPGLPSSTDLTATGIAGTIIAGSYQTAMGSSGYLYNESISTYTTVNAFNLSTVVTGVSDTNTNDFVGYYYSGSSIYGFAYFAGGGSSIRALTVTINPPLTMPPAALPSWTAGLPGYSQTYVSGGTGAYTSTFSAGSVPPGLSFIGLKLSGTPTVPGTYSFNLSISDSLNASDTFTPLDDPSATMGTYAMGVYFNVVVGYYEDVAGFHGFLYNGSTYTTLDDPAGNAGTTFADGIFENYIVGNFSDSIGMHGFIYNFLNSTYTTLDDPAAKPGATQPLAISGNDIVGTYTDSSLGTHGFLYDGSTWTTIDDPEATSPSILFYTTPSGISGPTIVGTYFTSSGGFPPSIASHGFVDSFGTYTTLDDTNALPGTTSLKGVFGNYYVGTYGDGTFTHGFYYSPGVNFIPLDDPAASPGMTTPTSVSFNTIAGYYGDSSGAHGFLATRQSDTVSRTFTVVINPPASLATLSLPAGTYAVPYSQTLNASGGTGLLTFSAIGLPSGLTLSGSGVLAGTPTVGGTFTVTVTATDSLGATGAKTYTLVIAPATFVVSVVGSSTVRAGSSFQVMVQAVDASGKPVTSYLGLGTATASLSPAGAPGNLPLTVPVNAAGLGLFEPNLTQTGSYTITVQNNDYTGSTTVTVIPAPADKLTFSAQPPNTATCLLFNVAVQIQDAFGNVVTSDSSDAVTLGIGSGPGGFLAGIITTATAVSGVASFPGLTLVAPGTYTLSAVVPNLSIAHFSTAFTVAPLEVVPGSFVGTPSGFSLQFNAPYLVNALMPVLYGQGFGATAPPPSVILTTDPSHLDDTAAYVEGSLLRDQADTHITFLATDTAYQALTGSPILPDGTYTAIVRSSAASNGFQALDAGGGFLDGLRSGTPGSGDYTATFVVNASAAHDAVVWVPATADGPGQPLNAPGNNQVGGGYPLYLSASAATVTTVQATLNYNPALLTVSGVSGPGFSLLASSTPGQAVLAYNGPALPAGSPTPIGFITATVPSGTAGSPMPYKSKDLLHLSGVSLNGGTIPVATSDALHLVAYVGDADGNGSYSSNDAVLITRVALQTDTGFAAYPLVDPVIVADTDGAGFIPADAALQANEAGVGFPAANLPSPPIPPGVHFQVIANNAEPARRLAVGGQGSGVRSAGVLTEVNINNAHPAARQSAVDRVFQAWGRGRYPRNSILASPGLADPWLQDSLESAIDSVLNL